MKMKRDYPIVQITQKGKKYLQSGHSWVYEGEVLELSEAIEDGALVDVLCQKTYLGTGFYNSHSKIRVRLVSRNAMIPLMKLSGCVGQNMPLTIVKPLCQMTILNVVDWYMAKPMISQV